MMILTTNRIKNQGKLQFAELFERIFPHGIEFEKLQTAKECRTAVKTRIFDFECNERFYIHCHCESCAHDNYIQVWDIAEALAMQSHIGCSCGEGGYVPIYRKR
jgi:hypothetical protein